MKIDNKVFSVILLAYHSGERVRMAFEKIKTLFDLEKIPFEFIIINDGSNDRGETRVVSRLMEKNNDEVRYFELSRNYTSHYAAFAGLSVCTGGCATIIPDDEQQPYGTLVKSYRFWELGEKIVLPVRSGRDDPKISKFWSNSFYWFLNQTTDFKYPPYGLDTWFIDREVIDVINSKISPINTTTITEILRLGYDPKLLFYERQKSLNSKSRWTFRKKLKLASDWFFTTSKFPIKLVTILGLFSFVLTLAMICFYIYIKTLGNQSYWSTNKVPGWVSLVVIISFFSGLILLSLAMIAEYIWRIFDEVKGRPGYLIKKNN
jgi:glycosyltransferase involved in cell wall biosynthesis